MSSRILLPVVFICSISLAVTVSFGKGGSQGSRGGSGGGGGGGQSSPQTVDHSASNAARKTVEEAATELKKATAAVTVIVTKAHKDYETSTEAASALAAVKATQTELDSTRAPVLKALKDSAAYKAAVAAKATAQTDRDAVVADSNSTPEDRVRTATAVMEAGKGVTTLETNALAADPRIASAQSKLVAANANWTGLLKKVDETLKDNPDWQAATKVVVDKQQALTAAQKSLSDALAQEARVARGY